MLKPVFYKRDYTLNSFQAPWLEVKAAKWDEIGGCDQAELAGWNLGRIDLAQALNLLRCGVELTDESEIPCWWGYVERIELYNGKTGAVCDLDLMSNRIRVRYVVLDYSGLSYRVEEQSQLTDWWESTSSQAIYGIKEEIISLNYATIGQSGALKKTTLDEKAWPIARPGIKVSSEQGDIFITLKGWWHSAAWRYYEQAAGIVENYALDSGALQDLGNVAANTYLAQSFATGTVGYKFSACWIQLAKIGAPVDSVRFWLCADNAGVPGTTVAFIDVSNTVISKGYGWTCFELGTAYDLAASTTYWLRFHRTGVIDGANFYRIKVDEDLRFSGGSFKISQTLAAWVARSPDADLVFRTSGLMETTTQIPLMAAAGCGGQFLSGCQVDQASGVYSNPWRKGTSTAQAEIKRLLQAGTSAGGRLICEITRERA